MDLEFGPFPCSRMISKMRSIYGGKWDNLLFHPPLGRMDSLRSYLLPAAKFSDDLTRFMSTEDAIIEPMEWEKSAAQALSISFGQLGNMGLRHVLHLHGREKVRKLLDAYAPPFLSSPPSGQMRFVLCLFLALPVNALLRPIKSPVMRKLYTVASGLLLVSHVKASSKSIYLLTAQLCT
jgi:hypothetical protein